MIARAIFEPTLPSILERSGKYRNSVIHAWLSIALFGKPPAQLGAAIAYQVGIVHIGLGSFVLAREVVYVESCRDGCEIVGVIVVQPKAVRRRSLLISRLDLRH